MKKFKLIIIAIIIIVVTVLFSLFMIDYTHKYDLTIKVNSVDEKSPDRILKVYDKGREIKFKKIEYTDGIFLCDYEVPAVGYIDIKDEKELIVIVKYNKKVIARIDK